MGAVGRGGEMVGVEMACLRLRVRMALGDARVATQGASGKWDFDEAIEKYIDLSYHDKKGGDSSTAVRRWRMFCVDAAADGSWVRALVEASATKDEKLGEEYLVMRFACWLVVEWGVQPSTAEGYISNTYPQCRRGTRGASAASWLGACQWRASRRYTRA